MNDIFDPKKNHTRIKHNRQKRMLLSSLNSIKRHCRRAVRTMRKTAKQKWLCDNYYLLVEEGNLCFRDLSKYPPLLSIDNKTSCIGLMCERLIKKDDSVISQEALDKTIKRAQQNRYMENSELNAIRMFLVAAAINNAAASLELFDEDEGANRLSHAVKTLQEIKNIDFERLRRENSIVEQIFLCDPSGDYPKMDEASRSLYCNKLSRSATEEGVSEQTAAENILKRARAAHGSKRHVGYYLLNGNEKRRRRKIGRLSILFQAAFSAIISLVLSIWAGAPYIAPIILLPVWQIIRPVIMYAAQNRVKPEYLPRFENGGKIPREGKTLVAVFTLLPDKNHSRQLYEKLKSIYYRNPLGEINYMLLADLKESKNPDEAKDKKDIAEAAKQIEKLNGEIGNRFFLMVRPRVYVKTQRAYAPWERKRGALTKLVLFIRELSSGTNRRPDDLHIYGDISLLQDTKYIAALDWDTDTGLDGISRLVGCAMHPMNRPVIDREKQIVINGYGIIAPKSCNELDDKGTLFSSVMSGAGGTGGYSVPVSEYYTDLFGESVFCGKGLIDAEVYAALMNSLPEQRILSHDSIESGIMRCAVASDVEFTDSFPGDWITFLKRNHRWIRGDVQNLPFAFGGIKNRIGSLTVFKLLDNVRRPLTDIAAALCLTLSAFVPFPASLCLSISAIASASFEHIFSAFISFAHDTGNLFTKRFYTGALSDFGGSMRRAAIAMVSIPLNAVISFDAVFRAAVRMLITKRNMLQWVTSAGTGGGFLSFVPFLAASYAISLFELIISPFFIPKLAASVTLLIIPLMMLLSGKTNGKILLSEKDRKLLTENAETMWRFFEENCNAENNYLPPDNIQFAPVGRTAYRTSPTNIGFMLLSAMAACDLGIIPVGKMLKMLAGALSSVNKMQKYKGNLYNWYDTRSLQPLEPKFVSSVDSGNFICCLCALKEGLSDCSENIVMSDKENDRQLKEILRMMAGQIDRLTDETDLSIFFDNPRRLFYIGIDGKSGCPTKAHYDLMMSESRLLSYYAAAKRIVPVRHWESLGRAMSRKGRYTGAAAWGGGVFEYFMPMLFLDCKSGSMLWESLRYCLYCQMTSVGGKTPWGISESGFHAFDMDLNYQYRSHGERHLKLRQNRDDALVVSSYSTMLTVCFAPKQAIRNIKRLYKAGAWGRYGLYEAVDYGKDGNRPKVIKSYMAHHVGMSIVAAANALRDNIFQRRFMSDSEIAAAAGLLDEKMPQCAAVISAAGAPLARKVERNAKKTTSENPDPMSPKLHILSNGRYNLHISDCGAGFSCCDGLDITRRSEDILRRPQGIFAVIEGEGASFSITRSPCFYPENTEGIDRRAEFADNYAAFYARKKDVEAGMQAAVLKEYTGEIRKIVVANHSGKKKKLSALLYFEPCLRPFRDDLAHPAYSRMFLQGEYNSMDASLLFGVRTKDGEKEKYLAVGLSEPLQFEFECDRQNILGLEGSDGLFAERKLTGSTAPPDTACAIRATLTVKPRSRRNFTLLICAADTKEQAAEQLKAIREKGGITNRELSGGIFSDSGICRALSQRVLPDVYFALKGSEGKTGLRRQDLWRFGISGDYPLISLNADEKTDTELVEGYVQLHKRMLESGINAELVIINRCKNAKDSALLADEINETIERASSRSLIGARGGIFIIEAQFHQKEFLDFINESAAYCDTRNAPDRKTPGEPYVMKRISECCPDGSQEKRGKCLSVLHGVFYEDKFEITSRPERIWTNILANPTFGTMASNLSLGCTWAINSRENKLTPWFNDPCRDNNGEMLMLCVDGTAYDMIKGSRAVFSPNECRYFGRAGDISFEVSVRVPERGMYKQVSAKLHNSGVERSPAGKNVFVGFYAEPVLGADRGISRHLRHEESEGTVYFENPWSMINGTVFFTADKSCKMLFDRAAAFAADPGQFNEKKPSGDCVMLIFAADTSKKEEEITFLAGFAKGRAAARRLKELALNDILHDSLASKRLKKKNAANRFDTGDAAVDFMMNVWVPHQIMGARINGRIGFYQSSGAWGFRDQLQDSVALLGVDPSVAKRQIFRCASKQFPEGDVMHWWHRLPGEDGGTRGVRTKCSDDMLWLIYAVCEYVKRTGDRDILRVRLPYIEGKELNGTEQERYFSPSKSELREDLLSHCGRAAEYMLSRIGAHGLPLIGNGDWNDGMNRVGVKGRGESVWLALFASLVLDAFALLCDSVGIKTDYADEAERLRKNIERHAWDGEWFLRGFFDDGTPLGSHKNRECKIDSISQSFAVFAGLNDNRVKTALESCKRYLVDDKNGVIKLFAPPFADSRPNPGYIMSYPAGLRENGGQYTHAACWLALAFFRTGDRKTAKKLLDMINSAKRCQNAETAERFGLEPYSIPADIYSNEMCSGRGGWSQYTGSAGWFYRVTAEYLRQGDSNESQSGESAR